MPQKKITKKMTTMVAKGKTAVSLTYKPTTKPKTMKTNIEVTPNHPAHQQVIEFMTELLPKVEMAKTEFDALQVVRENCLDTPFFWGAGGHHIWIHHSEKPNERVAIIRY